eukprot:TRINITY_DN2707_c0_g1_i5.p1 TRINITY_DN2707_c0_g1~~TRINITY_DN2707_c0_g1_i5.p1  ORF type:complete len:234 (-),score=95.46 TRINITY_DN2707_c0_g1_i5:113-814(-)
MEETGKEPAQDQAKPAEAEKDNANPLENASAEIKENTETSEDKANEEDKAEQKEAAKEKSLEKALEKKKEGNELFKAEKYHDALDCYTEAIDLIPDDAGKDKAAIHFNAGMAYGRIEDINSAINHYSVAVQLKPDYSKAFYQRMMAYQKKEEYGSALEDVRKLKELSFAEVNLKALERELEAKEKEKMEKMKNQVFGQLKSLGNSILGKFGMSIDNFKLNQNQDGSYNIAYQN